VKRLGAGEIVDGWFDTVLSWGYSLDFLHSLEHYKSFRKAPGGDVFHSVPFTGLV
jgi:hypothetical protein